MNSATRLNIVQSSVRVPRTKDVALTAVDSWSSGIPIDEETARDGAIRFSRAYLDQYWRNRITLSEQIYLHDETPHPVPAFEIESEGDEPAADRFPEFRPHLTEVRLPQGGGRHEDVGRQRPGACARPRPHLRATRHGQLDESFRCDQWS